METDRQTDKSTRWQFTAYEDQWHLFERIENYATTVAEWGWQVEIAPTTGNKHFQGFIRMRRQFRLPAMKKLFPGVHLEIARDWFKLINYCRKTETAVPGTRVQVTNNIEHWSLERTCIELAYHATAARAYYDEHRDILDSKNPDRQIFWYCCKEILRDEPFRASALAMPVVERMFTSLLTLWGEEGVRALVLQPAKAPEATESPSEVTAQENISASLV